MNTLDLTDYEKEKLQKFIQSVISECDQVLYQRLEQIWISELEKIKLKIAHKDRKKAPLLATNLIRERLPGIIKAYEKEKEMRCTTDIIEPIESTKE